VVLLFNIACGCCFNCHCGYTQACLTLNREEVSAGYGYAGMGPICERKKLVFAASPPRPFALPCPHNFPEPAPKKSASAASIRRKSRK